MEQILVSPPRSRVGLITEDERKRLMLTHKFALRYDTEVHRLSAHAKLIELDRAEPSTQQSRNSKACKRRPGRGRQGYVEAFIKSLLRSLGGKSGRRLISALIKVITGTR